MSGYAAGTACPGARERGWPEASGSLCASGEEMSIARAGCTGDDPPASGSVRDRSDASTIAAETTATVMPSAPSEAKSDVAISPTVDSSSCRPETSDANTRFTLHRLAARSGSRRAYDCCMVQVRVTGVALDASGQHVVLLKPIDEIPGDGMLLPIWIGQLEATSILIAIEQAPVPRPMAHDLMRTIIETLGAEVTRVEVTRIEDGTFYAEITLSTALGTRVIDARPSDAVALASRVGAGIWVAEAVMADAGVPDVLTETDAAEKLDEFKKFLSDVEPEDFEG